VPLVFSILAGAVFLSLAMSGAWLVVRRTGQSGWIDVVWSFATGLTGVAFAFFSGSVLWRQLLAAVLVAIWAFRLGGHIAVRSRKSGDDPRYAFLRQEWGEKFPARLFLFLQIQAASALVLALAVLLAARNPRPDLAWSDIAGVLVLAIAVIGEGTADRQLRAFTATHRGAVCDAGLWSWSRHPNYFFEFLGWFAYPLLALGTPWGWLAFAAPAFMYWLLVHASGIPPLEAHMLRTRGDQFRAYQARTNAFFPAPPHAKQDIA
jgi:steroid 5-alpha reductase family enzyme